MKKSKKLLSLILTVCMVLTLIPTTAFAADQVATDAGVRIVESAYDSTSQILTVDVQVKLPDGANGITSIGSIVSYDTSKLTLMDTIDFIDIIASEECSELNGEYAVYNEVADGYISSYGKKPAAYDIQNAEVYGKNGRAAIFVGLTVPSSGPNEAQYITEWQSVFGLMFRTNGDPNTVLNSESIRIADPVKDAAVIEGAYPANNDYVVSVNTGNTNFYKFGKMTGNTGGDLTGSDYLMAAEGNNTASYTGSTNRPPLDPITGTVKITGTAKYGETLSVDVSGITSANPGALSYQWYRNGSEISGADSATYELAAEDITATITVKVSAENYSGEVTSASFGPVEKGDHKGDDAKIDSVTKKGGTVTVTASGLSPGDVMEYGYSTSQDVDTVTNWTTDYVFQIMTAGDYYFFARAKGKPT